MEETEKGTESARQREGQVNTTETKKLQKVEERENEDINVTKRQERQKLSDLCLTSFIVSSSHESELKPKFGRVVCDS